MDLNEILKALGGLSLEQQEALYKEAMAATKDRLWVPNPGPQTEALLSEADELFYGGQAGGGKSDLEIGLALTEHHRSLILRRTNKEALGLVERIAEIVGNRDGWSGQQGIWRFPERTIEVSGCQLEEDKQKFKGSPHDLICVGRGTPVLLACGSFKPVEDIVVGDLVATLEGPRTITRAFRVSGRPAVRVTAGGVTQVQSASHRLLTLAGWLSSDDLCGPHPCSPPTVFRASGTPCEPTPDPGREPGLWPEESSACPQRRDEPLPPTSGQSNPQELAVYGVQRSPGSDYEASCASSPTTPQPHGSCGPQGLREQLPGSDARAPCLRFYEHVADDALGVTVPGDFPVGCRDEGHSDGGQPRFLPGLLLASTDDQALLQRPDGAGLPSPTGSEGGGPGHTPTHSRPTHRYPHPYGRGTRSTAAILAVSAWQVSEVVVDELFDLEVEEVNHFITRGGFINKNCMDEVSDFSRTQYEFITAWNRSTKAGQRCRIIAAGNPPTRPEGLWVLQRWAAWLDPRHPNPAKPGELRWYTTGDDGHEIEVDGPGPHLVGGEYVIARSRTFIPARLDDNPDLAATNYAATLAALPPELRAAYRDGRFDLGLQDGAYQVVPTRWIKAAQQRWTPQPPANVPMCTIGVDVAQGGTDSTVLAIRHDGWFAPMIAVPGHLTPTGSSVAGLVVQHRRDAAGVVIDMGGGYGGSALERLRDNGVETIGHKGAEASGARTKDRQFHFVNKRSEILWRFREALDPDQEGGSTIMLPDDPALVADLTAPTFEVVSRGIKVESKEDVCKRLGRSTDRGDAVVMAWSAGPRAANIQGGFPALARNKTPKVVMGHHQQRRRT